MVFTEPRPPGPLPANPVPSSSPAFATPLHPIPLRRTIPIPAPQLKPATILPVLLPPATLRPFAFRTFTKKYNLTLTSSALASLSTFIGRHCGSRWREEGLAEGVLEEVARMWKKDGGPVIVDGNSETLKNILKTLEGCMSGGKVAPSRALSRQTSFALSDSSKSSDSPLAAVGLDKQNSFNLSSLHVADEEDAEEDAVKDPREWIKVIGAFDQPRLAYNVQKKHFEKLTLKPSFFPPASHKTELFRQRYHLVQQRILRHESFQTPTFPGARTSNGGQLNKITPIANLLGRSGSSHLLLGLLTLSPTSSLALSDLTGSISLDLQHARPFPDEQSAWYAPGMIVLVEGVYMEDYSQTAESALGNTGGIGGTIGGKFVSSVLALPPCERRAASLGIQETQSNTGELLAGPAFGWTDFLGVGSERAMGSRMRRLEQQILGPGAPHAGNSKIIIASELNLDTPATLTALRTLLSSYDGLSPSEIPMAFVLMGNFLSQPALSGSPGTSSVDYKDAFNSLASVLADFPQLVGRTTLIMVPGDNDSWVSSFGAGAAAPIPRKPLADIFTNRVRRAVAEANREVGGLGKRKEGEVIWTTNPSRVSWFGCRGEMVLYRDDVTGRLRRTALTFNKPETQEDEEQAAQLTEDATMSGANLDTAPTDVANGEADTQMEVDETSKPPPQQQQEALAASVEEPQMQQARRLVKTLLDQAHLSPFPLDKRPVHWDYGHVLSLYPLPSALVIADPEAPAFSLNYNGCAVMNPGQLVESGRGARACWIEFDAMKGKGVVRREDG